MHPWDCGCILDFSAGKNSDEVCSSPTILEGLRIPGDICGRCLSHMTGRGKGRVDNGGIAVNFLGKGAPLGSTELSASSTN